MVGPCEYIHIGVIHSAESLKRWKPPIFSFGERNLLGGGVELKIKIYNHKILPDKVL